MHHTFLSLVNVINSPDEIRLLPAYLKGVYPILQQHFKDFEIILVNNLPGRSLQDAFGNIAEEIKSQVYILNLSSKTNKNHAIVAGLDRANGDYTVIFEFIFMEKPTLILDLFDRSQQHFDIVYLQANKRETHLPFRFLYGIFYGILRRYSALKIDDKAHDTRIISRRALNSLLRLRENLRYMKAIYSIVGYNTTHITTDQPLQAEDVGFRERFGASLVAISSFTTFLSSVLLWIFLISLVFLAIVIANALTVKFAGYDLLGNPQEAVTGWTFLVVLMSIFFAITCLNLYIMSIYLANIYHEIKKRPLYIIESVERY
ncbi:MAG: glycosyltransferase [Saprospiraceae bacterium]|nr:hypothetical protein [Lewinella sp.]